MESKDFFGAPDPEQQWTAPSVLSVVVDACAQDMGQFYHAKADGHFTTTDPESGTPYVLGPGEMQQNIQGWVRELQGGSDVGDKIVALVRGNPGWERVIAGRVIRKLRSSNGPE